MEKYIDTRELLAISIDESNIISTDRIMKIAVTTPSDAFYDENVSLGGTTINGEFCA